MSRARRRRCDAVGAAVRMDRMWRTRKERGEACRSACGNDGRREGARGRIMGEEQTALLAAAESTRGGEGGQRWEACEWNAARDEVECSCQDS